MPAQLEEVVVDAELFKLQHLAPDVPGGLLQRRSRRHRLSHAGGQLGRGQGFAGYLAVGQRGQLR